VTAGGCAPGEASDVSLARTATTTTVATTTTTTTTTVAPTTTAPPPSTTTTAPPPPPTTAAPPPPTTALPPPAAAGHDPHRGLGAWIDVYDWSRYKGNTPVVGPADVDRMADEGVQTLYVQTAKHDTPDDILDRDLLVPILERARARGLKIVAWYLPTFESVENDLRRLLASAALDVDAIGVDIESRAVADAAERSRRLVDLSSRLRADLPATSLAAIVLPPVVLEVINQSFWPSFPYRDIAPFYDAWMPMSYWTNRTEASGYRDAHRYTDENIRRLRNNVGQAALAVHPIGGIGDETTAADLDGFHAAALAHGSIGGSIYDYRTTDPAAWHRLRAFRY
jgi:hypothetical protein